MLMHVGDATSTTSMDVVQRYRFCVAWKQCYAADKRQSAVDVAKKQGGRRLSGNHGGDGWNDCNEERTECQIFDFAQLLASVDIMLIYQSTQRCRLCAVDVAKGRGEGDG